MKKVIREPRLWFLIFIDIISVFISGFASYFLFQYMQYSWKNIIIFSSILAVIVIITYGLLGLYKTIWTLGTFSDFVKIFIASVIVLLSGLLFAYIYHLINKSDLIAYRMAFITVVIFFICTLFSRYFAKAVNHFNYNYNIKKQNDKTRAMIVGTTNTAAICIDLLKNNQKYNYLPVCLISNNNRGKTLNDVKVVGETEDIPKMACAYKIDIIIIAIDCHNNESEIHKIKLICEDTKCDVILSSDLTL